MGPFEWAMWGSNVLCWVAFFAFGVWGSDINRRLRVHDALIQRYLRDQERR